METSSISSRIAKNSLIMYGRMIFVMALGLLTSRIVLQALGIENYGIYNLVGGLATFFSFINFALVASTQRFLNYEIGRNNQQKLKATFSTALLIHICLASVIVIFAEPIGLWLLNNELQIPETRHHAAFIVFQCSLATLFVQIISLPYNAVLISREKMSIYATITMVQSILNFSVAYSILVLGTKNLELYASLMWIVQLIVAMLYFSYSNLKYKETRGAFNFDKNILKEMLTFTGWNLYGGMSWMLCTQGLNILLGMFFTPVVNAARGIAVQVQSAVSQIYNNLNTVISPQLIQSYARQDETLFYSILYNSSKYFVFLLYVIAIPVFIKAPQILEIWLHDVPTYTTSFVRILLIASIFDALGVPLKLAVDACGKIKLYHFIIGSIQISVLLFAYLTLNFGGNPQSALYVYLIISSIALIARLIILQKILHNFSISYYTQKVLFKISIILLISYFSCQIISNYLSKTLTGLFIFILISVLIILIYVFYIGMNKVERNNIIQIISKKLKIKKTFN